MRSAKTIILFCVMGLLFPGTAWGQEDDEAIFQELSCSHCVQNEEATRMGKDYPNSLCFIQNVLDEGEGLFTSQIAFLTSFSDPKES